MTSLAQLRPTADDLREMARLAAPIVAVNVGMMLMGVVDSLMLGRVSGAALAAGVLGNFVFYLVGSFGIGLLLALDPVVSQAVGARDDEGVALGVQRGVLLAGATSLLLAAVLAPADTLLAALRQPADVAPAAAAYVRWSIPGVLPFLLFNVCRQSLQAIGLLRPILVATVIGNVVNALLNWIFIFGHAGAPALGVEGSAMSTAAARWVMLAAVAVAGWSALGPTLRPWRRQTGDWGALRRLAMIGAPIGLQFFAEANAFGFATVMMGWQGTTALAGHEVALNLASLTFMVPLGVSAAGTVMVGRAIGRGDAPAARRDAAAAIAVGVGFMALTALLFLAIPGLLARAYSIDPAVIVVASALIPIAGVFQVFDGLQVSATGVLRGAGDTRIPMLLHMGSFWVVGIPLGAWLCFGLDLGPPAIWWGLTFGLASAGGLQLARVRSRLGGALERLRV